MTSDFKSLSWKPSQKSIDNLLPALERFVILLYGRTLSVTNINDARKLLFSEGKRSQENIPPTRGALIQHIKRAAFQSGYVWAQSVIPCQIIPSPSEWGWLNSDQEWIPKWTDLPDASSACNELIHCGCKEACHGNCKCSKASLRCTTLCACSGHCYSTDTNVE